MVGEGEGGQGEWFVYVARVNSLVGGGDGGDVVIRTFFINVGGSC